MLITNRIPKLVASLNLLLGLSLMSFLFLFLFSFLLLFLFFSSLYSPPPTADVSQLESVTISEQMHKAGVNVRFLGYAMKYTTFVNFISIF